MVLYELASLTGWLVTVGFAAALLNFFLKLLHRQWITKLPEDYQALKSGYRAVMKFIVKHHKIIGGVTLALICFHFVYLFTTLGLSITGIIAISMMAVLVAVGIVIWRSGSKGRKLVPIHRVLAFLLLASIVAHLITKAVI